MNERNDNEYNEQNYRDGNNEEDNYSERNNEEEEYNEEEENDEKIFNCNFIKDSNKLIRYNKISYLKKKENEPIPVKPRNDSVYIIPSSLKQISVKEKKAMDEKLEKNMNENYKTIKKYLKEIDDRICLKKKEGKDLSQLQKSINGYLIAKFNNDNFLYMMSDREFFNVAFDKFKKDIEKRWNKYIENPKSKADELFDINETQKKEMEKEKERSLFYKRSRNALYRHAYLIFYNTTRVISNVKIEYDFWRSDMGKHIWGINSSANIYYKYHSSWSYKMFKCNLFYTEFSFGLFQKLFVKPLKYISRLGSYFSPLMRISGVNGLKASETPLWEMINISLVQISIGPVKINGLKFSFFDPIFFIMSLCFMTYLGLDKVAKINMPDAFYFLATYYYNRNGISCFDPSLQENGNLFTEDTYLDDVERKLYKIKRILVKINLVTPDRISTFVNSFASYFIV